MCPSRLSTALEYRPGCSSPWARVAPLRQDFPGFCRFRLVSFVRLRLWWEVRTLSESVSLWQVLVRKRVLVGASWVRSRVSVCRGFCRVSFTYCPASGSSVTIRPNPAESPGSCRLVLAPKTSFRIVHWQLCRCWICLPRLVSVPQQVGAQSRSLEPQA